MVKKNPEIGNWNILERHFPFEISQIPVMPPQALDSKTILIFFPMHSRPGPQTGPCQDIRGGPSRADKQKSGALKCRLCGSKLKFKRSSRAAQDRYECRGESGNEDGMVWYGIS